MEKKKLLLIVPTLHLGGQERVAVNTAELLMDTYDITFVVLDGKDAVFTPPCEVIDLAIPAVPGKLTKIANALRRAYALQKLKKAKQIDYTLSFGDTANLVNVLSGDSDHTFLTLHGYGSVYHSLIGRYIYQHCQKVACVSKVIISELTKLYQLPEGKAVVLYNPYDFPKMREQAEEPVMDYAFSPHTIVTHGRLEEVKNYPRLIKAFSVVRSVVPDAQLLIIGEGTQQRQLESLIATYHLENSVTLIGFRKNPFAYLARAALYVLSSYSEGFPNALVEGMTFLPAVAVDCKSGPREILSDGPINQISVGWDETDYGILVQAAKNREFSPKLTEDDLTLAQAILFMLKDPTRIEAFGKKAAGRVQIYSYDAYYVALREILED